MNDEVGLKLARLTLIVFGEKIRDDLTDGEILKARSMNLLYGKPIEEARAAEQALTEIAYRGIQKLDGQQKENASVSEVLDTYGNMMKELFSEFGITDGRYLRLIRALAMWTFYMDMLTDYDEDYRTGNYNGFIIKECSTLRECFDYNYMDFILKNRWINDEITDSLKSIQDTSPEWHILNKMIGHATRTMALRLLAGDDIKFRFVRCNKGDKSSKINN